jgi:hypothetical protein
MMEEAKFPGQVRNDLWARKQQEAVRAWIVRFEKELARTPSETRKKSLADAIQMAKSFLVKGGASE